MKLYKDQNLLVSKLVLADSFRKRLRGFMFYKDLPHEALLFKPCNSIHTFFMKVAIDVIFLDKDYLVVEKHLDLKKNKVIMPVKEAVMVIEGAAGKFSTIKIGDQLSIW